MEDNMERRTIEAGTILHMQGIPILVTEPFVAETHKNNWPLATAPLPERDDAPESSDATEWREE